jgi:predicted ATPase/DNA-binding SARP family transcriptional activator
MLRLYLFGSPRLERDGSGLPLRRSKALALLAYLAVTGRAQSRESLQALLWSEFPDADARNNLRRELSQLRAALGEAALASDRQQIAWGQGPNAWVDVTEFTTQLAAVRAHGHPGQLCDGCGRRLAESVQLVAGELLEGFHLADSAAFEDWLFYQREELRQQLGWALEALVGWHAARGELQPALSFARRWLSLDPLHEQSRRALMGLLAQAGQQAAALRQYEEFARLLDSELGATPEAATTALYQAIKAGALAPAPAGAAARHALPALAPGAAAPRAEPSQPPLTSFVGRRDEIELLVARLADPACRLLTLVGPGGIGKTRLAGEVAARCAQLFADGAQLVPLSGTTLPEHIPGAVASALGLSLLGTSGGWSELSTALREREQLLVLDNLEQLLAVGPDLAALLHAAPRLKLLVTSREALGLPEEWRWAVRGLALPAEEDAPDLERSEAVQLFLARARQRGTAVGGDELKAVAQICRLVGGMPLAIELAAPWTATLSCQEIAQEIAGGLDLLTAGNSAAVERHRSVQAIFDQTWARLPEPLQRALARLSVFPAGCTREVALAVAGASLPVLSQLVERAILQRSADGRYLLHPLVRQYAAQRLRESPDEAEAVAAACGRHYTAWLCAPYESYFAYGAVEGMNLLRAERDNLRSLFPAILAHASGEPLRQVLQLVQNIYFACGPYQEWVELMEAAEAHLRSGSPTPEHELVRAHVLTTLGFFALRQGRIEAARESFTESNTLFAKLGATPRMGSATDPELGLGMLAMVAGDYRAAGRYAERSRARAEASGQRHNQAYAWYLRAEAAQAQGLLPAAHTAARKALALAHTSGATWLTAYTRNQLGQIATALGRYDEAEGHYQASYATREAFHDAEGMAAALLGRGEVAARRGELACAAQRYGESVALFAQAGDRGGTARARLGLGQALAACGDYGAGWRAIQAALAEARALDFQHVVIAALVQAAAVLVANGRVTEAIAPLTQALIHPASHNDTTRLAEELLVRCEELTPAASFAAESARGRESGLDRLADELLAMSTPSPR